VAAEQFWIATPLGGALLRLNGASVAELKLVQDACDAEDAAAHPLAAQVQQELDEYFAGARREFSIPLATRGTEFQRRVWSELLKIPYGTTVSYTELTLRLGEIKALRAVGRANGANPVWIIIPCHRVIGANGELTGYAGGLEVKRRLLELEGALQPGLFGGHV